jgi:hypothetical protein
MRRIHAGVPAALMLGAALVAGCSSASPASTATAIPAPAGDAVLTMSGRISSTNDPNGLALDLSTIEDMGLVRYTVHDPWLDDDLEFTGVLVTDLLRVAGAAPDATSLRITALDDYMVEIPIADAVRWPIMLATQTDGAPMAIEDKGPTRIVYPANPEIDTLKTKDLWIWQITTIEVR